jgi:hypothetical protein
LIGPAQRGKTQDPHSGVEDFAVRVEERKAHCPAGKENPPCRWLEEEQTGKVTYRFAWSTHGAGGASKDQCVGAGQKHRTRVVGEHHSFLQARRAEQKTEAFQKKRQRRHAVEGTQSG